MKKIVGLFFSIVFLVLVCTDLSAQVFTEDIKAMNIYYQNQQQFQMKVKMEVFSTSNRKVEVGFSKASITKSREGFLYEMDNTDMLMTSGELIIVNHPQKVLLYRTITKAEYESMQKQYYTQQLDSALQKYDSVHFEKIENGKKYYTIFFSKNTIKKAELVLDEKESYIRELVYYYDTKVNPNVARVEITFTNTTAAATFGPELFSAKRFIVKEGKRIKPSAKYTGYEVRNVDE